MGKQNSISLAEFFWLNASLFKKLSSSLAKQCRRKENIPYLVAEIFRHASFGVILREPGVHSNGYLKRKKGLPFGEFSIISILKILRILNFSQVTTSKLFNSVKDLGHNSVRILNKGRYVLRQMSCKPYMKKPEWQLPEAWATFGDWDSPIGSEIQKNQKWTQMDIASSRMESSPSAAAMELWVWWWGCGCCAPSGTDIDTTKVDRLEKFSAFAVGGSWVYTTCIIVDAS